MCIIAIKPRGKEFMEEDVIRTMFRNNPDGAGFCYADKAKVVIKKGYMDVDSFIEAIKHIPNHKDKNVVLHFRIGTAGSNSKGNCHPYPISHKVEDLKATQINTELGIVHNGIIPIKADKEHDMNDTQTYIRDNLWARYTKNKYFYKNEKIQNKIKNEINSKMVFLDNNGDFYLVGDFIGTVAGYIYSNDTYLDWDKRDWKYYNYDIEESEEEYSLENEAIMLDGDDYIYIDGQKVYADEYPLFIVSTNDIYYYDINDEFVKISSYAFDKDRELVSYQKRLAEYNDTPF